MFDQILNQAAGAQKCLPRRMLITLKWLFYNQCMCLTVSGSSWRYSCNFSVNLKCTELISQRLS